MRLASKQELYQRIVRIDRWIRNNPGKFDGVTQRLIERREIVRIYDDAPDHDYILCGMPRGPVRQIPEIQVTILGQ